MCQLFFVCESINKIAIVDFLRDDWNQGKKALIMVFALLFGGVELRYSKCECLRFFIQACFCPWLHSSYRTNAYIFFVVDTRKYPGGMARLRVA